MSGGPDGPPADLADVHCHFVPGVDDGAPDLAAAIHWLRRGLEAGVRRVATTPHLPASRADGAYRRRAEEAFRELRSAVRDELPELEIRLAFEIRLDGAPVDPGDRGLWLGTGGHLLVEYDLLRLPAGDPVAPVEPLLSAGRTPVLAHPERYRGGGGDVDWGRRLRDEGVRMAVNAGSLTGRYGPEPRRTARRLLAEGLVDLVASDHHARPRRSEGLADARELLAAIDPAAARRLLWENPGAILDGESMAAPPSIELPERGTRTAGASHEARGGSG